MNDKQLGVRQGFHRPWKTPPSPSWMARPADPWLEQTVTIRRVLGLTIFWLLCIGIPVVLALVYLAQQAKP